ncbi:phosphatidylserine decarboxylase [Falsiroseomonas sp. HW251]|uniref:phosphatidylserine decarboxylase n=1 Tax=Falsiroseomonas sp. HW251 TaxID=3390998 RepID=UPI003D3200D8
MSLASTIRMVLAPPHPAGRPFIWGGAALALVGLFLTKWLFWPALLFTLFCLYFFRDPERVTPTRHQVVVSPADGRVVLVGSAVPPPELGLGDQPLPRIAVFLSVLDVHVNRIPVAGVVTRIAYRAGLFLNAALDKASEDNERNALVVRMTDGRDVAVVQIAGLIARRIVCTVREGDRLEAGERFGIIRFGSRTDVYLPPGTKLLALPGQIMTGGETVIAELPALVTT